MKIRIVAKRAGTAAAKILQNGFLFIGLISHPRAEEVGANFSGTSSFGVLIPTSMSTQAMEMMASTTAKSLTMYLSHDGKKGEIRKFFSINETKKVPMKRSRDIK